MAATFALAGAVWAAAAGPVRGARYSGKTSEKQTMTVVVSSTGHAISKLATAIVNDGLCGKAGGKVYAISGANITLYTNDSFSLDAPGTAPHASALHFIVTGTFFGKTVSGTIAEIDGHCPAPKQVENPYLATFTATTG